MHVLCTPNMYRTQLLTPCHLLFDVAVHLLTSSVHVPIGPDAQEAEAAAGEKAVAGPAGVAVAETATAAPAPTAAILASAPDKPGTAGISRFPPGMQSICEGVVLLWVCATAAGLHCSSRLEKDFYMLAWCSYSICSA